MEAGHEALRRGWFGAGVLFLDLHGYDEAPVEPAQALDALLRALGVPVEHIPPEIEQRAALYRSLLAKMSDRMLILLDNASSEAQVWPLLPGMGPHKVLVTSRHTLAGLEARLVDVKVLDESAGMALVDAALRLARSQDGRIGNDSDGARRLVKACGGMPLALQIVAALLKADPALQVKDLADELAAERTRLKRLRYDDGSGRSAPSVKAAFDLSYRKLDETAARIFRLLPLIPGPDIPSIATAVLADLPVSDARKVLGSLVKAHLIEVAPSHDIRWRMHDLLRLYAHELSKKYAQTDDREHLRGRLLSYYFYVTDAADDFLQGLTDSYRVWRFDDYAIPQTAQDRLLSYYPSGMPPPHLRDVFRSASFRTRAEAAAWFETGQMTLAAAVDMAAEANFPDIAYCLGLILADYLGSRRPFDSWVPAINFKGHVYSSHHYSTRVDQIRERLRELQRFDLAIAAIKDAVTAFRATGDSHGEAMALNNLGLALLSDRQVKEAIAALNEAVAAYKRVRDRHGEGLALNNLGASLRAARQFDNAIMAHGEAAAIFRETGDQRGERRALDNLEMARVAKRANLSA